MENSSSKLNFWQIHLVYLPKRGPISKPELITKSLEIIKESDFNGAQMGNPQSFFKLSIGKGPCYCLMR